MALLTDFFVGSVTPSGEGPIVTPVQYTLIPSNALNVRKYAKKVAESNGAKSFFELKITEDGKGPSAQLHYLISKVFEVQGVDNTLRPSRVNLAIHIPATALGIDRVQLVAGLLRQLVDFLRMKPLDADQATELPDDGYIIPLERVHTILNGEI